MGAPVTDLFTENVQDNLTNNKEKYTNQNCTQWPVQIQGKYNQDDLRNNVNGQEQGIDDKRNNKQRFSLVVVQLRPPAFKGNNADQEVTGKPPKQDSPQAPHRSPRSVLPELETQDPVVQYTYADTGSKPHLQRDKIRIRWRRRWTNTTINHQRRNNQPYAEIEKLQHLRSTDGGVLGPDVEHDNKQHQQRPDMNKCVTNLKDHSIG